MWNTQEIYSVSVLARRWKRGTIKADGVIAAGVAAFNFSFSPLSLWGCDEEYALLPLDSLSLIPHE